MKGRHTSVVDTASCARVAAAIQAHHKRVWAICYRMTGQRADADELSQEAIARAIERAEQITEQDATGWLMRLTTRVCIDHLRRKKIERRLNELVDPVEEMAWVPESADSAPDAAAILREDVRYAVVVALQTLSAKQRAALVLHDVCERSLEEVAEALDCNANAAKALLHRARVALAQARFHGDVDVPVDRAVVERFASAIQAGAIETLAELLSPNVWGIVDGGGVVRGSTKPTFGSRAVARQWANAKRRLGQPVVTEIRSINGEPAVVIRLAAAPELVLAIVHVETHAERVITLRVNRDPKKIAFLRPLAH